MSNPRQNKRNSVPQSRGEQMRVSANGRKKRRKLKDGFVLFLLFVALICVGLVLSMTVLFNAQSISCENSAVRYSDSQIIAAAGLKKGDNMFRLNTAFVEEKIEKTLPYIGKAEIKRRLPDTIVVCVEYTSASAAIKYGSGYVLLDESGKVLETDVAVLSDYIAEINGVEVLQAIAGETVEFADSSYLEYLTMMTKEFREAGLTQITSYNFDDADNVTVEIDYKIDVIFGKVTEIEGKIDFGKEVMLQNLDSAKAGKVIIDLTEDNVASVRNEKDMFAADEAASSAYADSLNGSGETVTSDEQSTQSEESVSEPSGADVVG